jgi:hypothetical protein
VKIMVSSIVSQSGAIGCPSLSGRYSTCERSLVNRLIPPTCGLGVLPGVARQQSRRPKLMWISHLLGLLAGQRHHPGTGGVGNRRLLARSRAVVERRHHAKPHPDNHDGVAFLVDVATKPVRSVRVQVVLLEDVVMAIDRTTTNRSRFLAEAAKARLHEMA